MRLLVAAAAGLVAAPALADDLVISASGTLDVVSDPGGLLVDGGAWSIVSVYDGLGQMDFDPAVGVGVYSTADVVGDFGANVVTIAGETDTLVLDDQPLDDVLGGGGFLFGDELRLGVRAAGTAQGLTTAEIVLRFVDASGGALSSDALPPVGTSLDDFPLVDVTALLVFDAQGAQVAEARLVVDALRVTPAPGSAGLFALCGLLVSRRRR